MAILPFSDQQPYELSNGYSILVQSSSLYFFILQSRYILVVGIDLNNFNIQTKSSQYFWKRVPDPSVFHFSYIRTIKAQKWNLLK